MADDELETNILGFPIKAKGVNIVNIVIMAGALSFALWLLYAGNHDNKEQLMDIQQNLVQRAEEHLRMVDALKALNESKTATSTAINEQNYIILSDGEERARIKRGLSMPQSLRDKINR